MNGDKRKEFITKTIVLTTVAHVHAMRTGWFQKYSDWLPMPSKKLEGGLR